MTDLGSTIARYKALDLKRSQVGLTPDEEDEWVEVKESIERSIDPDLPPSSRRNTLRVPSHLAVNFETASGFYKAYLRNISEGGVYIATVRELPLGSRFHITLSVNEEQVLLHVEVVWVNKNPSPGSGLEPGVGVAWLNLDPQDKARIKSMVHRALDEIGEEPT